MFEAIRDRLSQRNACVDLLAVCFGIGAWVAINGIWVEMPLLVTVLPESWDLGSYMTLVIQIANIGPLLYILARFLLPSLKPAPIIYVVILIGCTASLLLIFFWTETTTTKGEERSTAFLTLLFFLALVDCTSSVLYFPYMAIWKEIYFSSYLIGEGLSGFLPSIFSLFQGGGGEIKCVNVSVTNASGYESWQLQQAPLDPNFSVEWFFFFVFSMMLLSSAAFLLLQFVGRLRTERSACDGSLESSRKLQKVETPGDNKKSINRRTFGIMLAIQIWCCAIANGFMPSIQSYSCGPYGNVEYHLAITFSTMANPLAAFLTMFLPRIRLLLISFLAAVSTGIAAYLIALALMSPTPVLVDTAAGASLMIIGWTLYSGLITYTRLEISISMREESAQSVFWSGFATQLGSFIGALVSFFLVNKTSIFAYYDPCA